MGVKGTCRSANGGGCPSFMPVLHIASGLPSCLPSSSLVVNFQPIGANFRQKVAKVNNFLVRFGVFSGKSETKNGKSEIYFGFGAFVVLLSSSFVVAVVVSTCGICAGFRTCRTCHRSALVLLWCVPCLLPAFLLYACRAACEYGFISRFKGRFWRVLGRGCMFV